MPTMKAVALNIETEGNPDMLDIIPEPDIKLGNTKDPEKIRIRQEEARQKTISHLALDPYFGRVLCATLAIRKAEADGAIGLKTVTVFAADHTERDLIDWIWKHLAGTASEAVRLITFNGSGFDIPFLQIRSLLNKIVAPMITVNRYHTMDPAGGHFDAMTFLHGTNDNNPMGLSRTLAFYAKQILGENFPYGDIDQSQLGERLRAGDRNTIKDLCEWNATRTLLLYETIQHYLG